MWQSVPSSENWVEVWRGNDPEAVGRLLDAEGILMRIATGSHHGSNLGLIGLFRRPALARLLVPAADSNRANAIVAANKGKA